MRNEGTLDRRAVVAALLQDPGDLLVVTGLGAATYDAGATDLAAVAAACGWSETVTARSMDEVELLRSRLRHQAVFAVVKISPAEVPRYLPPRDGAYLADRFRRALGVQLP